MKRLADLVVRRPRLCGGLLMLSVLGAIVQLPRLRLDFSLEPLLIGDAAAVRELEEFRRAVPPRSVELVVTVRFDRLLRRAELGRVGELERHLARLEEVASTRSPASVRVVAHVVGIPLLRPFVDLLGDRTAHELAAEHPLLRRTLLSEDGREAAIALVRAPGADPQRMLEAVERVVGEKAPAEARVAVVGGPPVQRALERLMIGGMARSVALQALAFALMLAALFRTVRGCLAPLGVLFVALALVLGLQAALGLEISTIDVAIPGLVMIIGLSDAVHMVHRFEEEFARRGDRPAAVRAMLEGVGVACLHTSLTTAIGFLSLLTASHPAIRSFGLEAAMAVMVTFVVVAVGLPLALLVWPARAAAHRPWPARRAGRVLGRPWAVWGGTVVVVVVSLMGAGRVVVDSHWLEELPRDEPAVAELARYQEQFAGPLRIDVELRGALGDARAVRGVAELGRRLLAEPDVTHAESYVDWLTEVLGRLPATDEEVRQGLRWLSLTGEEFPAHVIDRDLRHGRLVFRTGDTGTRRYFELVETIENTARAVLPETVRARVGGFSRIAHRSAREIVTTLLSSLFVTLGAITAFMAVVHRSLWIGAITFVPDILPILVALGVNGWAGITLRIGIVMIYCLGLGLAVDNAIHFLTRLREERAAHGGARPVELLRRTLAGVGPAMATTTAVLAIGALCYLPSGFRSLHDLGILLTVVVVTALLADLALLPLLLAAWLRRS